MPPWWLSRCPSPQHDPDGRNNLASHATALERDLRPADTAFVTFSGFSRHGGFGGLTPSRTKKATLGNCVGVTTPAVVLLERRECASGATLALIQISGGLGGHNVLGDHPAALTIKINAAFSFECDQTYTCQFTLFDAESAIGKYSQSKINRCKRDLQCEFICDCWYQRAIPRQTFCLAVARRRICNFGRVALTPTPCRPTLLSFVMVIAQD